MILEKIRDEKTQGLTCDKGMVKIGHRVCVPQDARLTEEIMTEAHHTPYTEHPRAIKNVSRSSNKFLVGWNEEGYS